MSNVWYTMYSMMYVTSHYCVCKSLQFKLHVCQSFLVLVTFNITNIMY